MRLYEIINPSDPYFLEAEDFKEAAVAVLMLSPRLGLEEVGEGGASMPVFIFGGMEKWLDANVCPVKDIDRFMEGHAGGIAAALESVLIGKPGERKVFEAAMGAIDDPKKREDFRLKWHEGKRSSLNNIGAEAWDLARRIRAKMQKVGSGQ